MCGSGARTFTDPIPTRNSAANNPKGPTDSYDPEEPGRDQTRAARRLVPVQRQYCIRYKAGSRGKGEVTSGSNNLGFRCVVSAK